MTLLTASYRPLQVPKTTRAPSPLLGRTVLLPSFPSGQHNALASSTQDSKMLGPVSRSLLRQRMPQVGRRLCTPRPYGMLPLGRPIPQVPRNATAVYAAFPATLHHYSPRRFSSLYDCIEKSSRPDDLIGQAVYVADDGLVYPYVEKPSPHSPLDVSPYYPRPMPLCLCCNN